MKERDAQRKAAEEAITAQKNATLYERLGGAPAINAVVEGMYEKIFNDPKLSDFFRKTDKEKQKQAQRDFLTYATGGSSEWHGKDMKTAHEGRGILNKEFDLVVGHVVTTMKDLNVPEDLIGEVGALLEPLRSQISI